MRLRQILVTMVLVAPLLVISPSAIAETEDPAIIGFDFDNGLSANESISLSGSIEFDSIPDSVEWSIVSDILSLTGELTDTIQELDSQNDRILWSWHTDLDLAEIPVCTCYFTITVTFQESSWSDTRVIFIGDTMRSGLQIYSPGFADWAHETLIVTGWSYHPTVWADSETRFFTYPAISSVQACSEEGDSDTTQLLSVISPSGDFSTTLNISLLEDGWYSLYVENYDPSEVAFAQQCVGIRVNNAPPYVSIVGDSYFVEYSGEISFDASSSDDPYWGREGMEYMWVLRKPSHSGQTPLNIQIGSGTYSLPADSGGNYTLTLRLTDSGGVSSTTVYDFVIENQIPSAVASVSGTPMIDGDTIRLSVGNGWELDASGSSDSDNDLASLRCVWKIDYEPMYEGCQRTLTWPEETELESCVLTLDVIDDDDEFSSISVLLIHPDSSEPLPYSVIVLLVSALFMLSAIFLRYRSTDESTGIPTWDSDSDK